MSSPGLCNECRTPPDGGRPLDQGNRFTFLWPKQSRRSDVKSSK